VALAGAWRAGSVELPDGRIGHAELSLGTVLITLGLSTEPPTGTPLATRWTLTAMTLVFVEDVDAAVQRALAGSPLRKPIRYRHGSWPDRLLPSREVPWRVEPAAIMDQ
jgi:uncharacterized glyoxalase superfamily protein PhnB